MITSTKNDKKWSKIQNDQNHKNQKNRKSDKIDKMKKHKKLQNAKMKKWKNDVKILRLTPPMLISALKSGPVVPPGIEKVPNQAARISQSVDFGHLSDILGILGVGHFFTLFLSLFWFCVFTLLMILHFWLFDDFPFLPFLVFFIFCPFCVIRPYGNYKCPFFDSFLGS